MKDFYGFILSFLYEQKIGHALQKNLSLARLCVIRFADFLGWSVAHVPAMNCRATERAPLRGLGWVWNLEPAMNCLLNEIDWFNLS